MIEANTIYFVGSGPGDPELITLKAKKLLEKADVIVYSGSLLNPKLLEYAKKTQYFMMQLFWTGIRFMKS